MQPLMPIRRRKKINPNLADLNLSTKIPKLPFDDGHPINNLPVNVNILPPPQQSAFVNHDDPIMFVKSTMVDELEQFVQPKHKKTSTILHRKNNRIKEEYDDGENTKDNQHKYVDKKTQGDITNAKSTKYDGPNDEINMTEGLKPMREPESQSQITKKNKARDNVWFIEYIIELGLIFLGFSSAYMIYYYLISAAPPNKTDWITGVNHVDFFIEHQIAPAIYGWWFISNEGPLARFHSYISNYSSLFVLCTALIATAYLLLSKNEIVKSTQDALKMKASPTTRLLIAWSYLTALFSFSIPNVFKWMGWVLSPIGALITILLIVIYNNVMAGLAQLFLTAMGLYLMSGAEKYQSTKNFSVVLPNPMVSHTVVEPVLQTTLPISVPSVLTTPLPTIPLPTGLPTLSSLLPKKGGGSNYCSSTSPAPLSALELINQASFVMLRYLKEIIIMLFVAVKLVNCNMLTYSGGIGAYLLNACVFMGSIASIAMKWATNTVVDTGVVIEYTAAKIGGGNNSNIDIGSNMIPTYLC